ncbi:hypothetical protein MHBO_000583 [Bonamia ostreae]|uniref:RING-type domain-containing protein n=1 Tax=Bonamia ostreae TaxID=126728 RepID=A0ABV2AGR0_9EUKA
MNTDETIGVIIGSLIVALILVTFLVFLYKGILSRMKNAKYYKLVNLISHLEESCSVCLNDYSSKRPPYMLACGHIFHRECILRWAITNKPTCPYCRKIYEKFED